MKTMRKTYTERLEAATSWEEVLEITEPYPAWQYDSNVDQYSNEDSLWYSNEDEGEERPDFHELLSEVKEQITLDEFNIFERYLNGDSLRVIAKDEDCSHETIRTRIKSILERIRRY